MAFTLKLLITILFVYPVLFIVNTVVHIFFVLFVLPEHTYQPINVYHALLQIVLIAVSIALSALSATLVTSSCPPTRSVSPALPTVLCALLHPHASSVRKDSLLESATPVAYLVPATASFVKMRPVSNVRLATFVQMVVPVCVWAAHKVAPHVSLLSSAVNASVVSISPLRTRRSLSFRLASRVLHPVWSALLNQYAQYALHSSHSLIKVHVEHVRQGASLARYNCI